MASTKVMDQPGRNEEDLPSTSTAVGPLAETTCSSITNEVCFIMIMLSLLKLNSNYDKLISQTRKVTSQIAAIPDAVTVHRFRTSKPKPAQKQYKPNVMKCHFCGKQNEMLKSKCPAYGKTCNQKNHFSCSAV